MRSSPFGNPAGPGSASPAEFCSQLQDFAEPLWFAVFCREIWGPSAWKDLRFYLDSDRGGWSERTYRGWADGDNEPAPRAIILLLRSPVGNLLTDFVMRPDPPKWWIDVVEDRRQAAILRAAMREISK